MSTSPPSNDGPNPVLAGFAVGVLLLAFTLCTAVMWFLPEISGNFNLGLGSGPGQTWSPPTATPAPADTPIPATQLPDPTPTSEPIPTTPTVDLPVPEGPHTFQVGGRAENVNDGPVNLRRSPGYLNKPSGDRIGLVAPGDRLEIIGGPKLADELTWWNVRWQDKAGWMAEFRASGIRILAPLGE